MVAHEDCGATSRGQHYQCVADEDDNLPCKGGDNKPGNHADTCKREEWQAAMST